MNRLEQELAGSRSQLRRRDAHEKIRLGGLVVTAGLRDADPDLILGALAVLADALDAQDQRTLETMRANGRRFAREEGLADQAN